ncbi:MAG: 2'-5' RNA ligase family protein [Micrococcales bacterium]|nr:2'-5' RNA ligase family protein [Micrococcales bacterium]
MGTIGVAVAIPHPWGDQLQEQRASFGDPQASAIPPHVTILPPTDVPDETLPDFRRHIAESAAAAAPFTMVLRGTGTFRPISPVVFVTVAQGISECERLERAVRSGPVERRLEFNYHPHVTVAHHLHDEALDRAFDALSDFQCTFSVGALHLYEHGEDGVWRAEAEYPLGAGPA